MNSTLNPAANTSHPLLLTRPRDGPVEPRNPLAIASGGVEQVLLDGFLDALHDRSNQPLLDKLELLLDGVLARFCDSGCHPLDDFPAHLVELRASPFQQIHLLRDTVYDVAALLQRALRRLRNHILGRSKIPSKLVENSGLLTMLRKYVGDELLLRRLALRDPL
ncbi:unnamed protein product, partial [Closterium sp. NIES-53]